ncbi:hypothetical protein ABL850_14945 [Variovorax paradoxus]|uniref:hypothetical protein n=1 Tax=Variovorax paradoxus TaxID=34073 RepID=UPI003AAA89A8
MTNQLKAARDLSPEDQFERYLADAIDRAPEPLRRLGEWLSHRLDEDDWKTAERFVLGAMESIPNTKAPMAETAAPSEIDLIEKAAVRVGMKSLMNHGAASCVYSEGCNGVSQAHLIAFAREVALHCVAALATTPAATPAAPGEVTDRAETSGTSLLIQIWGEDIDHPLTTIAPNWDGVRRFCVEHYTGSEDAENLCGNILDTLKAEFDEHEAEETGKPYTEQWEIGGLSIERVCDCTPRAALSHSAPVAAPAKNCEWTNCVHRVGDVCCNDKEQK